MIQTKKLDPGLSGPTKHGQPCFVGFAMFCWVLRSIAVNMAESASDVPVTFDLLDGIIVENGVPLLGTLTADEQAEVENVVTLLDSANENSLEQFDIEENTTVTTRHKQVSENELDRLAGKNTAQATSY